MHHSHFTVKNVSHSVREIGLIKKAANDCCGGCCDGFCGECCGPRICCGGSSWANSASYTSAMELEAAAAKLEAGQSTVRSKFPEVQEMELEQKHARSMKVQQELTMVLRQATNSASRCVVTFDAHTNVEDIIRFNSMLSSLASPGPESAGKLFGSGGGFWSSGASSSGPSTSFWSRRTPRQKKAILLTPVVLILLYLIVTALGRAGRGGGGGESYSSPSQTCCWSSYTTGCENYSGEGSDDGRCSQLSSRTCTSDSDCY